MAAKMERHRSVTDQQLLAIDLLAGGQRVTHVAERVGISREQLWRWRTQDPNFMAKLNEVRTEAHAARVDRFWSLTDKAQSVLEESLDEGDPRAAMDLVKLAARGLTDVTVSHSSVPRKATGDSGQRQPDGWKCSECESVPRSERGLMLHNRAKHSKGDGSMVPWRHRGRAR